MTEPLSPGSVIGILGGGQLGRMLSLAAARLGLTCHIYDPAPAPPAAQVSAFCTTAAWDDIGALETFARAVDVITYEFENVPVAALDAIEAIRPIRPGRLALATSQDRLTEKRFIRKLGLGTAPFAESGSIAELEEAARAVGLPAILKTRRLGYDGKGQVRIGAEADLAAAWDEIGGAPSILEGFVDFTCEISVIGARSLDGQVACFDPGENTHEGGILRSTRVPARVPASVSTDAVLLTAQMLTALDYVGVMGVELFVAPRGLLVNEFAPRVHNSGHWTQTGCSICQFEQHIRAIAGWPLGSGERHADIEMENLIGSDLDRLPQIRAEGAAALHLYGKAETRAGRKMGHVNRVIGRG